jgi:hypothetical protein
LTVVDDDNDESEDNDIIMLTIEEADEGKDNRTKSSDDGLDMATWGIIIIIIVIILVILILFMWMKKKKTKDKKTVGAIKPKHTLKIEGMEEPDVIERPGAISVSPQSISQPEHETPTVTVMTPTIAEAGPDQQFEEPAVYEPLLPEPTGVIGTLPEDKPKKSKRKGEEPEIITPDIEYAPEIPTQLETGNGFKDEVSKSKPPASTEVLIPEEFNDMPSDGPFPEGSEQVMEQPKPKKSLKKKVVKK